MIEPDPDRWERVKDIFEGASLRDMADRVAFLDTACADDDDLRRQVEHLLAHQEPARDFLERPVVQWPNLTGSSEPSRRVFLPDHVIKGRFRIVHHLASGGMSEVYRARDLELQRDVALKVVRHRLAGDPDRVARLRQEGLATARLNHPNIVTLFEIGQDQDVLFIVSELLIGETLRRRLASGRPPVQLALRWAKEIAQGLDAAHHEGIVHRDVKPDNVFITQDGRIKLLDFGLAKLFSEQAQAGDVAGTPVDTAPFMVFGTPGYMAPEQVHGRPIDHRADIFAFGVLLQEMLAGHQPPSDHQRPSGDHVPPGIRALVVRCTEPNPEHRFTSMGEVLAALDGSSRAAPRRWAVALAAGLVLAAIAASLPSTRLSSLWTPGTSKDDRSPDTGLPTSTLAVLPIINLSGDPLTEQVSVGMSSTIAHNIAGIPGLTVASQADTARYLIGQRDATAALNDLGVALLLDLALERRAADGFRMHARLHRTAVADPVWTGAYVGDVPAIHHALMSDLPRLLATGGFSFRFTEADRARLIRMPSASATALVDYFEGRRLLARPDTKRDAEDAIAALQRAVAADPHFVMAVTSLSEAYLLRYQETRDAVWLDRAAETAGHALTLDATDASGHVALAKVKHQTGEIAEAIRELRLAVQLVPDSDDAHRLLGRFLAENGNTAEGVQELQRAISLRPGFWTNHYTLGFVRYREGRYQDAIPSFLRVIELQPNYAGGYVILGASYHRSGQIDLAIGNYEHAARIGQDANAYANLGLLYYIDRRFNAALESYLAALDKDRLSPWLWQDIGNVYSQLRLRHDASAAYDKAIALAAKQLTVNPRDASMLALMGLSEAKSGRPADAERHAAEALALTGNDREVLFTRAATYAVLNQREKALAALQSALENGYEPALARSDADLDNLRSSPEFKQLVGEEPKRAGR